MGTEDVELACFAQTLAQQKEMHLDAPHFNSEGPQLGIESSVLAQAH